MTDILAGIAGIIAGLICWPIGRMIGFGTYFGVSPIGILIGLLAPGLILYSVVPDWNGKCELIYLAAAFIAYTIFRIIRKT